MSLTTGTHRFGPGSGRLLVRTNRTGLGRKVGHDLTIEVRRWVAEATADTADPESSSVTLDAEVDSFEVVEGVGGVKPLTDGDRAEIRKILREKVLHSGRYPTIAFRSTAVTGMPEAFTVQGDLTIMGETHPVTVQGRLDGDRLRGSATVTQSRWGVKPYSAFFGTLKLADQVEVEFDFAAPTA